MSGLFKRVKSQFFVNKFLKHVFNKISKLNNHSWKKVQNYFFVEKNDAQINRVAVVKRAPSPLKKCFRKKNPFSLFVQIRPTKLCAEVFLKQTSLEIFNFRWFFGSEKLAFNIKLLMKLDRQRIKKIPHTILETSIISQIIL